MKLDILFKAMRSYKIRLAENDPEYEEARKAYWELRNAQKYWKADNRRLWKDEVRIVPIDVMIDVQNHMLYDEFGKMAKEAELAGTHVFFDDYVEMAREYSAFADVTLGVLEDGFEFLRDLWGDNETYGQNNPDGTFAYSRKPNYKVLNYEYENTGGNCMVGIFEVWLPEEKRTAYVMANEEGASIVSVDYIRNEIEIDDYDEITIDTVDWGRVTGHEKYFELYRHCLNEYTKSDCKHFGYVRGIAYHLLSDDLKRKVPIKYRKFAHEEFGDLIDTDGYNIIVPPDFE